MQRLRISFSRGEKLKFISHLDLIRLFQRAFHRAGIALAYSEGFNPHPRMSLAAPLALGVTSDAELMDVVLAKFVSPHAFTEVVSRQLSVRATEALVRRLQRPAKKPAGKPDPDIQRLQNRLEESLCAKVRIQHQASGKGKLVISYNNADELEGILGHFQLDDE